MNAIMGRRWGGGVNAAPVNETVSGGSEGDLLHVVKMFGARRARAPCAGSVQMSAGGSCSRGAAAAHSWWGHVKTPESFPVLLKKIHFYG